MTAIDAYLARERETLRAATPRPWRVLTDAENYAGETGTPRSLALMTDPPGDYPEEIIGEIWDGNHPGDANAKAITSAVNDREVLLDAVELLADIQQRHFPPNSPGWETIQSVLSRLTADSEALHG